VRAMMAAVIALLSLQGLPNWKDIPATGDWLVNPINAKAQLYRNGEHELVLANGLLARRFRIQPNLATISLELPQSKTEFLRAVRPEAIVEIDGKRFEVGGLKGQPNQAFLMSDWLASLKSDPNAFQFSGYSVEPTHAAVPWRGQNRVPGALYPPKGIALHLAFKHRMFPELQIGVVYELFDGMPLMSKRVEVVNAGKSKIELQRFISEELAVVEPESIVESTNEWRAPNLTVVTDYSFGGMAQTNSNRTVNWVPDPEYATQVNYDRQTPCLMQVKPPLGPDSIVSAGETFRTFTTYELFHDSTERERQGLAIRRMYRTLAPWSLDNPIMLHLTSTDPKIVHTAIDQAAECGFEMIVISFWSGLDMEDDSPANIAKFKEFADYAHKKGLRIGGYSLLASRSIDKANDVVNPKPIFGASPCLGSKWGIEYFAKLRKFITETGFDLLEHDGSYPGDTCASTVHPGHRGLEDSQWNQFQEIAEFYRWCQAHNVFLNVPDYYFLSGSNKTGMGYRESNWSLPREQQQVHARQNLFDGTWTKTPSMGWMMVPLVEYQGGGPAATIEPLKDHLHDYEMHLANNFGYGAQACYRGSRIYDAPETKAAVLKWVNWFKQHRDILESDVIHIRRADGRNLDAVLHVNPTLKEPGLLMVWNPTGEEMEQEIQVPLYYTGLSGRASIAQDGGKSVGIKLGSNSEVQIRAKVPARSCSYWVFTKP
jgi:hypothetical protein